MPSACREAGRSAVHAPPDAGAVTGWGDTQLKVHLSRLVDRRPSHAAGQGYEYGLLYDGEGADGGRFVRGLSDASIWWERLEKASSSSGAIASISSLPFSPVIVTA